MLVMMMISAHSLVLMQSQTVECLTMLILAIMLYALGMSILDSGQGLGLYYSKPRLLSLPGGTHAAIDVRPSGIFDYFPIIRISRNLQGILTLDT